MDFAIIYFGLTRATKKVFFTHLYKIINVLKKNNLTYKIFMHTWNIKDNTQNILGKVIRQKIDYTEYTLLNPDVYKIESQDDFINSINYKFLYKNEWGPLLIKNHICALESMKRGLEMVEDSKEEFKHIMFLRPDAMIRNELPIDKILLHPDKISIPNDNHWEGYNDRFAVMNYKNACIYGKRINELEEFLKNEQITSEKYVKFIINKYKIPVNLIDFNFEIIRP